MTSAPPPDDEHPPAPGHQTAPARTSGLAIAALVLGLVGLLISWATFLVPSILAVVFGAVALRQTRPGSGMGGRGMAITGLALGVATSLIVTVLWVVFWGGLGDALDEAEKAVASATATPEPILTTTTPPPPDLGGYTPTVRDFKVAVKVTEKDCFGSAGCLVTYTINLAYTGAETLDPSTSYDVTYEVRGPEDGPSIDTLTVTGGEYDVPSDNTVTTPSSATKLTAVVTDVSEG